MPQKSESLASRGDSDQPMGGHFRVRRGIPDGMITLEASIQQAVTDGKLLSESAKNIHGLLAKSSSPIDRASIAPG